MKLRLMVCASLVLFAPMASSAQDWELEVHVGGGFVGNASGSGSLPAVGDAFVTNIGFPSRRVPSWYFGDGAELFNSVLSAFGRPDRIAALDAILVDGLAERGNGVNVGIRVGRSLGQRLGVEFNLDVTRAPVELTTAAVSGVEAANNSFVPAFDSLLRNAPITNGVAASEFEILHGAGRQITATGAVNLNLASGGAIVPYVTVGGGVIANQGDQPQAALDGSYSFLFQGTGPIDETDRVLVRHVSDDNVVVGLIGGGVKADLSDRAGVRVDVRVHLGNDSSRTLLSATPARVASNNVAWLAATVVPSVQFSNNTAVGPTTLSAPPLADFETFAADGLFRQILLTVGYFWRF